MKRFVALIMSVLVLALAVAMTLVFKVPTMDVDAPVSYEWKGEESFDIDNVIVMNKNAGEDFVILQLSDTQMSELLKSKLELKRQITYLVDNVQPDLIVITGDCVAGGNSNYLCGTLCEIMDSFKTPWAPVFGNHDWDNLDNPYYQIKLYEESEYCLFRTGPNNLDNNDDYDSLGNYIIQIEENGAPVYSLFMINSNMYRTYTIEGKTSNGYDYIYPEQISWYADNVNALSDYYNTPIKSMQFFHIPLVEFEEAYKAYENGTVGIYISGERNEGECPAMENTGMFAKIKELNSTTHIFVGHEHVNNYFLCYQGVYFKYCLKTGDHSYYDDHLQGGTKITIGNNVSVEDVFSLR